MCFSGGRYQKTKATRVIISMMPMIFIFGFAKNYLLGQKLRLFYGKNWAIFDPWFTDFSYVNYNRNTRNSDTDYCISIVFYIGKVCRYGSNIAQIFPYNRRNFFPSKYFLANPKIEIIGIIEINALVALVFRYLPPLNHIRKKQIFL